MIKSCKKPPVYFPTVTGAICSFNSQYADLPLKSHKIALTATQSGSGTPSPYNVRPISGYSAINISQSGADTLTPTVHTITIGSTVYGGEYDARTGLFTVTSGVITFDGSNDENWEIFVGTGVNQLFVTMSGVVSSASDIKTICNRFKSIKITDRQNNYDTCYTGATSICFNVNNYTIETWKSWLADNPTTVVYELATPQTIQLPPCLIDTLQGENNVWADTGNTTLEYLKAGR